MKETCKCLEPNPESVRAVPNRKNLYCIDCGEDLKEPTPQPLGMSGDREEPWWLEQVYEIARATDPNDGWDSERVEKAVNAILAEERKQVLASAREKVVDILYDEGAITSKTPVEHRKPNHGSCCTCQTCGHPNDYECVCSTNRILSALNSLDKMG